MLFKEIALVGVGNARSPSSEAAQSLHSTVVHCSLAAHRRPRALGCPKRGLTQRRRLVMKKMPWLALLALAPPALAQTQQEHQQHHPGGQPPAAQAQPAPVAPAPPPGAAPSQPQSQMPTGEMMKNMPEHCRAMMQNMPAGCMGMMQGMMGGICRGNRV
jgi:hypothetical protein